MRTCVLPDHRRHLDAIIRRCPIFRELHPTFSIRWDDQLIAMSGALLDRWPEFWGLQTRQGPRHPFAIVRASKIMADEKLASIRPLYSHTDNMCTDRLLRFLGFRRITAAMVGGRCMSQLVKE